MFIIFYLFPNLFSSLEFTPSEDLNADNNFNVFGGGGTGGGTAIARSGGQSLSLISGNSNNENLGNHNGNENAHNSLASLDAFFYRKERH